MRQVVRIKNPLYGKDLYIWSVEPGQDHGTLKVMATGDWVSQRYPASVIHDEFEVIHEAENLLVPEGL